MDHKAKTNLQAARILKEHSFFDSCASRAYYAAYLAGWAWMAANNQDPPRDDRGNKYWPHATFADTLFHWGALRELDHRDDFEFLRNQRVKADYFPDPLTEAEAGEAFGIATDLVIQFVEVDE